MTLDGYTAELTQWLEQEAGTRPLRYRSLSGGDICQTQQITAEDGRMFCVKYQASAPPDFFEAEAAGLKALADEGSLRVPRVFGVTQDFIVMEYIEPGATSPYYWTNLGEQLARLHSTPAPAFGFTRPNYCGRTPQPNPQMQDGHRFFAQHRLMYQGELARERNLLASKELSALERLCERLPSLIPQQPPVLLHGDLWAGNIHSDTHSQPVLIDPACYWGWAEAELAMTRLFGGFEPRFYDSYQQVRPLEPGWQERMPLYNLYHLLNHLNLFGSSYHSQVLRVLEQFA